MKRLLTMALVLAMMATMFVVTPVAYAADSVVMNFSAVPNIEEVDEKVIFSANFSGVKNAAWVIWTVYATNNSENKDDYEIIFVDQKRGNKADKKYVIDETTGDPVIDAVTGEPKVINAFEFIWNTESESKLKNKGPFYIEGKVFFLENAKPIVKETTYKFVSYYTVQEEIIKIFDTDDDATIKDGADGLSITLPSCYVEEDVTKPESKFDETVIKFLLDEQGEFADRKYKEKKTNYSREDKSTHINKEKFDEDLYNAIVLASYNSRNKESISNLIKVDYKKVELTDDDIKKFNNLSNNEEIDDNLAKYNYGQKSDFVNQFRSLVFLEELSVQDYDNIMSYLEGAFENSTYYYYDSYADGATLSSPKTLNDTFNELYGYIDGDDVEADNFAAAKLAISQAKESYNNLGDLKKTFEDLIDDFDGDGGSGEGFGGGDAGGYTPPTGANKEPVAYVPTNPIVGEDVPKFVDIDDVVWAHEAINALAKEKVLVGVTSTQFQPNANVTREQFVQIIVKTFGLTSSGTSAPFADVDQSAWYAGSLNVAYELGIISGIGDGAFGVGATITRQDMATIMYRVASFLGINLTAKSDRTLDDAASISGYALGAVNVLYKAGIINGVSDGVFAGSQIATRAQAAKLCYDLREAK